MASTQYSVNDKGEKVIAASRRADGSVRKERKVRAGYLPQDEVPIYVPRHIRERRAAESEHPTSSSASAAGASARQRPSSSVPGLAEPRPPPQRPAAPSARTEVSTASSATRGNSVDDALDALGKLNIREPPAGEATTSASASAPAPIHRGRGSSKYLENLGGAAEVEGSNAVRGGTEESSRAAAPPRAPAAAPPRPPGLADPWDD